jgi:hypothetical protein
MAVLKPFGSDGILPGKGKKEKNLDFSSILYLHFYSKFDRFSGLYQ